MWKQEKVEAQLETLRLLQDIAAVSGGLAWHFMSPSHEEKKTVHDHSDMDIFVPPSKANDAISRLKSRGFMRYWTKYDGTPGFYRYGKTSETSMPGKDNYKRVKVLVDLFIEEIPTIQLKGFKVVEPSFLLSLYGHKHASKACTAVKAATLLIQRGINPVGRNELIGMP